MALGTLSIDLEARLGKLFTVTRDLRLLQPGSHSGDPA